jgi:hypothetical protein
MNIYNLTNEYKLIEAQLMDENCDKEIFVSLLNSMQGELKNKIINYAFVIKNLENAYDGITDAILQMQDRRDRIYDKIEALKNIALNAMRETNIDKIESEYFNVSIRNNAPKVIIEDDSKIPIEFMRVKEIKEPDKVKIKEFMINGEVLEGVHLETSKSLQIK